MRNQPIGLEKAFLDALFGEDELGAVIRAHIHIESRVHELLKLLVPYSDMLPRLRFEQSIKLACALGLQDSSIGAIKELGNIRNKFGHQLDTKLTSGMVDKIFENMSEDDRKMILQSYKMVKIDEIACPFESLNPKSKFIIISVGLDSLLCQAIQEAEKNKTN